MEPPELKSHLGLAAALALRTIEIKVNIEIKVSAKLNPLSRAYSTASGIITYCSTILARNLAW